MEDTQTAAMEQEKNLFDEDPPAQKESKTDALLSLVYQKRHQPRYQGPKVQAQANLRFSSSQTA